MLFNPFPRSPQEENYSDMKIHTPLTSLFLLLSVGYSYSVEQTEFEAKQIEERQRSIQAMHDTFLAASNCLGPVPMAPLVVTNILCNPFWEAESSNRLLTPKHEVELAVSGSLTEGELDHSTDN